MTSITAIQQELTTMSEHLLWLHLCFARQGESNWEEISAVDCFGLIVQERIRRHSETCENVECGFSPSDSRNFC